MESDPSTCKNRVCVGCERVKLFGVGSRCLHIGRHLLAPINGGCRARYHLCRPTCTLFNPLTTALAIINPRVCRFFPSLSIIIVCVSDFSSAESSCKTLLGPIFQFYGARAGFDLTFVASLLNKVCYCPSKMRKKVGRVVHCSRTRVVKTLINEFFTLFCYIRVGCS